MIPPRESYVWPALIICASIMAVLYTGYDVVREVRIGNESTARAEEKQSDRRSVITNLLVGVSGLSLAEIQRGFWYESRDAYGTSSFFYFDLYSTALEDLSPEQLEALRAHIQNSDVVRDRHMREVPPEALPPALRFHNAVYESALAGTSTRSIENALKARVSSGHASAKDMQNLSYLAELRGAYDERDAFDKENCTRFRVRCSADTAVTVKGRVVDENGSPIEGAHVSILSRAGVPAYTTGSSGVFDFEVRANDMEKLRLRAYKRNFSDGYADAVVLPGANEGRTYALDDITLESPTAMYRINFIRRSVTGKNNAFFPDGSATIKTDYSVYDIPAHAIVHADGRVYDGDTVDVYLYEFRKGDSPESLVQVDTFDEVRGYAGDLMKSFGMPYIQFFAPDGEELHVQSTRPMTLTYRIPDMDALYMNTDRVYQSLTKDDMRRLVQASAGKVRAIDRAFLIKERMLRFPAFWVLDRKRGVWDNVGIDVLDENGTIRTIFYTQKTDV